MISGPRWKVMKFLLAVGLPRFHSRTGVSANVTVVFSSSLRCRVPLSWHLPNWPPWGCLPAANVSQVECTSHSCTWIWEIKMCRGRLRHCAPLVQICSSSSFLSETIEWEYLVSVWLRQLDFNETQRGVRVPAGQWTDIEVLVRPGSQESLTWRLFCWSVLLKHHYCISLCKPYRWAVAPPSPFSRCQLSSLSLPRLVDEITGTPTVADSATCTEDWGGGARQIIMSGRLYYWKLWQQQSI